MGQGFREVVRQSRLRWTRRDREPVQRTKTQPSVPSTLNTYTVVIYLQTVKSDRAEMASHPRQLVLKGRLDHRIHEPVNNRLHRLD